MSSVPFVDLETGETQTHPVWKAYMLLNRQALKIQANPLMVAFPSLERFDVSKTTRIFLRNVKTLFIGLQDYLNKPGSCPNSVYKRVLSKHPEYPPEDVFWRITFFL